MLEIRDAETGLSVTLEPDPEPRDPRLVEDGVFRIVTWTRSLGDPHAWPSPASFHAAITPDMAVIVPLVRVETRHGPILAKASRTDDRIAGYAFATFERLCLEFGLDEIAEIIRADVMEEAETVCLGELLTYEYFLTGEVYRLEVVDARGQTIETRRDLYGEDHARHFAQTVFDRIVTGTKVDG